MILLFLLGFIIKLILKIYIVFGMLFFWFRFLKSIILFVSEFILCLNFFSFEVLISFLLNDKFDVLFGILILKDLNNVFIFEVFIFFVY